jgi:hypothetical protein
LLEWRFSQELPLVLPCQAAGIGQMNIRAVAFFSVQIPHND